MCFVHLNELSLAFMTKWPLGAAGYLRISSRRSQKGSHCHLLLPDQHPHDARRVHRPMNGKENLHLSVHLYHVHQVSSKYFFVYPLSERYGPRAVHNWSIWVRNRYYRGHTTVHWFMIRLRSIFVVQSVAHSPMAGFSVRFEPHSQVSLSHAAWF
ncbi:hypothetical protein FVEG_16259 [Fusarium verticillioides 7600]|uniref:Uncharacterized protein n=1 Tax=Gibberella moniliformis (strain M3125 / FGSC 7600) TaxID=334819 RepID=W7M9R3_GIBM7|nr:hypothetical protein FVEG_16259 [Fusarium verticillioides 7600]EWG48333.1 hypothetical protein FVEG_16259 [Fusarium verticillioides 7600]